MKSHFQRSVKAKQWTVVLEILLGVRLRVSRRVRVSVGAGVWLSQTSVLLAHRREATFQSRSVVQSDVFTNCPQYLFNSVSLAVETFCTFLPAFQIFPISLNSMLMPASVQRLNGQGISPCVSPHPATHSVLSLVDTMTTVLAIVAAFLALASLVVATLQDCLHPQRMRNLSKDGHTVSMTIRQQDRGARPASACI
jgi:hypothetical protein